MSIPTRHLIAFGLLVIACGCGGDPEARTVDIHSGGKRSVPDVERPPAVARKSFAPAEPAAETPTGPDSSTPATGPTTAATPAATDLSDTEETAPATIHGEWEITEATQDGSADENLVGEVYVFSADNRKLTIHFGGDRSPFGTFRLDCTIDESRKHVDYPLGTDTFHGIYRIDNDQLTLCFNIDERPTEFTSTEDNRNRLLVLKRIADSAAASGTPAEAEAAEEEGWTELFNGYDLSGWKGAVGNPLERARMSSAELADAQAAADQRMRQHWQAVDGVLEFDGRGDNLCTEQDYGDFELSLDWKIARGGDSGIYLRGCPQVQIWDTTSGKPNADLGSGSLFNNTINARWPAEYADRPVGEWNTFFIRMVGEHVTVDLNGRRVVDDIVMENYFEPGRPIYPTGPIELQKFGGRLWFRNIRIRELSPTHPTDPGTAMTPAEALAALEQTGFEFSEEDGLKAVFAGDQLTDADLAPFQFLPEITGIALIDAPVTDAGLKYLTGLENLTALDLEYARITDEGLRLIAQMTHLQELGIRFCENVTADCLNHLRPLTGLTVLLIDGVDIGPGQLQFAREMAGLEMFSFFSSEGLADSDLRILGGMTKLTDLSLAGLPWVNDNAVSHLNNLKALEGLDLTSTDISDRALQTVAGLPRLQALSLVDTGVGDDGMDHLSQLTDLRIVDLSYTEVTPRGLAALRNCPVSQLTLRGPSVTDRHLAPLRQWKDLTDLDLRGDYAPDEDQSIPTQITLRGVRTLSEFDQLQVLRLSDNPQITNAAVPYLSKLKNLIVLELTATGITSDGGRAIADAIDGLEYENLGIPEE